MKPMLSPDVLLSLIIGASTHKPIICDLQTNEDGPIKVPNKVTLLTSRTCMSDHKQRCSLLYNKSSSFKVLNQLYNRHVIDQRLQKAVATILGETGNPPSTGAVYVTLSSIYTYLGLRFLSVSSQQLLYNIDDDTHLSATIQSIYSQPHARSFHFVIFCSVQCILNVLKQAQQSAVQFTTRWLVVPTGCTTLTDLFMHYPEIPSLDVITLDDVTCDTKFQNHLTLDIYKLESRGIIPPRRIGYIDNVGNITFMDQVFSQRRNDLGGRTLKVATREWDPFVIKSIINGSVKYEGVCMDLLNELARVLNFRYTVIEPEDGAFGELVNGTWTGLVGLLAHKKVDLAVATLSPMASRGEVIDFSTPYYFQRSAIILRMPDSSSNKWFTLIAPFRYEVHICVFFALILSTVFLFVVEELNPGNIWTDNRHSSRLKRFLNLLWYNYGAITAKGGSNLPSTVSGRTILCCWWLFTVISAATYSGNLVAFLTDCRGKLPFNSLAEMVEQNTYSWGALGGGILSSVFGDSTREEYKLVWRGMQDDPYKLSQNINHHKRRCDTEAYAFLGSVDLYNSWKSQDCAFLKIDDPFLMSHYTFGLQKNSSYTRIFSEQILGINEAGLLQLWYDKWKPKVRCNTGKSAKRVDVLGLQSIFYALGAGIVLASVMLCIELTYGRMYGNKQLRLSQAYKVGNMER